MVDEMFDGAQMDVAEAEAEDSGMGAHAGAAMGAPGGGGGQQQGQGQGSSQQAANQAATLLGELTYSERTVHADFDKDFGELFDDKDLN